MIFIKIGLIDSGLGAIFVLNELIKNKKYNDYILYLDYINNPFGNKKEEELLKILNEAIKFLKQKKCDQIIIACNTLSIIAIKYNINNVITPITYFKKEIKKYEKTNNVLLATSYTINSNIYDTKNNLKTDLVSYIEGNNDKKISYYLSKIKNYDVIFLGCTHYHYLINKIKDKKVIDSALLLANNINYNDDKLKITIYINKINRNIINHINYHIHVLKYDIKLSK